MKDRLFFILVVILAATLCLGAKMTSKVGPLKGYTKVAAAAPSEPYDCTAGNEGEIIYVDDNNDNGYAKLCFCSYDDNPGSYEWVNADGLAACF